MRKNLYGISATGVIVALVGSGFGTVAATGAGGVFVGIVETVVGAQAANATTTNTRTAILKMVR
jgi:hypothetical protein